MPTASSVQHTIPKASRVAYATEAELSVSPGEEASLAAEVGAILREETGADPQVAAFEALARSYTELPA